MRRSGSSGLALAGRGFAVVVHGCDRNSSPSNNFLLTKITHQGEFLAQIHPMMHLDEIPIDLYSEDYLIDNK